MAKEIATVSGTDVAIAGDYEEYAALGYEGTTEKDYSRPFIQVLQPLSPQVEEELGKSGDYWVSGFNANLGPTMTFIPVFTRQEYNEWVPRDAGGGFVGSYETDDVEVEDAIAQAIERHGKSGWLNKLRIGNNLLVQTILMFMMVDVHGSWLPAVMPVTSTKIKPYTNFRTLLNGCKLPSGKPFPLFAHKCLAKTTKKKNDFGTFFVPEFGFAAETPAECRLSPKSTLFVSAFEFYKSLAAGELNVDRGKMSTDDAAGGDEIPF